MQQRPQPYSIVHGCGLTFGRCYSNVCQCSLSFGGHLLPCTPFPLVFVPNSNFSLLKTQISPHPGCATFLGDTNANGGALQPPNFASMEYLTSAFSVLRKTANSASNILQMQLSVIQPCTSLVTPTLSLTLIQFQNFLGLQWVIWIIASVKMAEDIVPWFLVSLFYCLNLAAC